MDRARPTPLRFGLAVTTLAALVFFAVLLLRLDARLSKQEVANHRTLAATGSIVTLNRGVTTRLGEVSALTEQARASLAATSSLTPLLDQLHGALSSVNATVATAGGGAAVSQATLSEISGVLGALQTKTADMASASKGLSSQEGAVVGALRGIVGDLQAAVADARRIRQLFDPGPPS